MLAVVQIPIFDPRGLVPVAEATRRLRRLDKPPWDMPDLVREAHEDRRPPFVRSAGVVVERRPTGLRGRFAEEVFCRARRAARLPVLTGLDLPYPGDPDSLVTVWPRVRFRTLFHDGALVGKFEIGFTVQGRDERRALLDHGADAFAAHLLSQLVEVRGGVHPVSSLVEAGPAFAAFYDRASSRHPTRWQRIWGFFRRPVPPPPCEAGTPFVMMVAAKGAAIPSLATNEVAVWNRCRVYRWRARVRGRHAECALIAEEGARNSDEARRLRILLNRIHAELSAADATLSHLQLRLRDARRPRELADLRRLVTWFDAHALDDIEALVSRIARQSELLGGPDIGQSVLQTLWDDRYERLHTRREALWRDLDLACGGAPEAVTSYQRRRIFLSYRRADDRRLARQLQRRLRARLPTGEVFLDRDMRLGADWQRTISRALRRFDTMVVLIGPNWIGETPNGRLVERVDDIVRREVEIGLRHRMRVLPVLTGGATFPATATLPESLRPLARLNAKPLSVGASFETQLAALMPDLLA